MNIVTLLPFIVLIGAMFLMTRSAKNKQRQAVQMRDSIQPGSGVRTIGGMYATVKEVHDDTILLEVAPGVHAIFAKNAVGAVLEDSEYNFIVHGIEPEPVDADAPVVPDDASSLTEADADGSVQDESEKTDVEKVDVAKTDLTKSDDDKADRAADGKGDSGTK
ncbi:preprotein translocase subunit YajC [Streptomyces sp. P1-3]|uniref:preprotein translocase subunit YajC n=1 Tax=Streptomyces sp. P1-3 TaxID=3421658 RepID=UPI003D3690B1